MVIANETLKKKNRFFYVNALPYNHRGAFIPPFGTFITNANRDNAIVINHENCHYNQFKKLGFWSFVVKYFKEIIDDGYNYMDMEKECRFEETVFCQNNYTTCYNIN